MIVDLQEEGGKIQIVEGGCHTDRKWLLERNNSVRRHTIKKLLFSIRFSFRIYQPTGRPLLLACQEMLYFTLGRKVDYKINGESEGQFNFSLHYIL